MPVFIRRYTHDIERGSNLDLLMRGFHGIGNRFVDALFAIALAVATKEDNSAEIRQRIQEATRKLNAAGDPLRQAVEKNQPKQS
jgi:hypothetical protein